MPTQLTPSSSPPPLSHPLASRIDYGVNKAEPGEQVKIRCDLPKPKPSQREGSFMHDGSVAQSSCDARSVEGCMMVDRLQADSAIPSAHT